MSQKNEYQEHKDIIIYMHIGSDQCNAGLVVWAALNMTSAIRMCIAHEFNDVMP